MINAWEKMYVLYIYSFYSKFLMASKKKIQNDNPLPDLKPKFLLIVQVISNEK